LSSPTWIGPDIRQLVRRVLSNLVQALCDSASYLYGIIFVATGGILEADLTPQYVDFTT
jgi:hypothetical protein